MCACVWVCVFASLRKWCDCFGVELHIAVANKKFNMYYESKLNAEAEERKRPRLITRLNFAHWNRKAKKILKWIFWAAKESHIWKSNSKKPFDFRTFFFGWRKTHLYIVLMDEGIELAWDFLLSRVFQRRRRRRRTATTVAAAAAQPWCICTRCMCWGSTDWKRDISSGGNALLIFFQREYRLTVMVTSSHNK